MSRQATVFVTHEEEKAEKGQAPEKITWACTFELPSCRGMEASDPGWAHRADYFSPAGHGASWRMRWDTRSGGFKGVAQDIIFRFAGHKRVPRTYIVDPVLRN